MDDKKGKIIFIHHCFTSLVSTPRRSIDRSRRFPFLSTHYRIESNATDASQHICAYVYLNRSNFYFFGNFSSPSRNANDGMEFRYKLTALIRPDISLKKKKKRGEKYAKFSNESRDQKTLADVDLFLHARQISLTAGGFPVFFIPSRGTGKSR